MPVIKEKSGRWKVTCEFDKDMKVLNSDVLGVRYECEFSARMSSENRVEAAETMLSIFMNVLRNYKVDTYASGGASQFNTLFANAKGGVAGCNGTVLPKSVKVILTVCMCSKYVAPDKKSEIVIEVQGSKAKKEFKIPLDRINVTGPGDFSPDLELRKVQGWNRDLVRFIDADNVFS